MCVHVRVCTCLRVWRRGPPHCQPLPSPCPHPPTTPPPPPKAADTLFLRAALAATVKRGVSVHLLFAFEYAVLASAALVTCAKYVL